jgi:plasmid replication initiation protein
MACPFFSLSKSRHLTPIKLRIGEVAIRVEATAAHSMVTIWCADVLIWAASQLVEARPLTRPVNCAPIRDIAHERTYGCRTHVA